MPLTGIEIGGTPGTGGGTTPVAVPNVVGKLRPQAEALLEDFGFVTEMTVVTAGGTPEEV
jgi:beta-lactam-binding protein with PASTA domain